MNAAISTLATTREESAIPPRAAHPNDLDRKRIERALKDRKRYRYVTPRVDKVEGGYLVTCPCCSRNVDPEGGPVDVALLISDGHGRWQLFSKDHGADRWTLEVVHERLADALVELNADADRKFWQ